MMTFRRLLLSAAAALLAGTAATAQTESTKPNSDAFDLAAVTAPQFNEIQTRAARTRLKRIWRTYDAAARRYDAADRSRSRTGRARGFQRAADGFSVSLKALRKWRDKFAGRDARVRLESRRLEQHLTGARRAAHLRLANAYISRGTYQMALDTVERVLMYHPADSEALKLRTHAQFLLAASLNG